MKKYSIEIKWAFLFIIMTFVWIFIEKLAGLHSEHIDKHPVYTNFIAIPAILIYLLAMYDKRKNYYSGQMSWKQGFVCGLIITAIVTVLSPVTQVIVSEVISPEFFPNVIKYSVSSGALKQEEAEQYFNLKNYIIQGLIGAPVMGIVTSVITAFIAKSKQSAV